MFYVSLPFTLIVLGSALYAARQHPHPIRWGWFLFCGIPAVVACWAPAIAGLFALLATALLGWYFVRRRLPTFLPLAAVAVAVPYGLIGWQSLREERERDQLRAQYPFESMVDRLPEPQGRLRTPPTGAAATRLDRFEDAALTEYHQTRRTDQLQELHGRNVDAFVNNPGFGVTRMTRIRMHAEDLEDQGQDTTPSQPGSPAIWGLGESFEPTTNADRELFGEMHTGGMLDFVNPRRWGYVQNRNRVAGFLPHRFSKVPEARTWQVQRIELMGLLKHPEPVVYLSDKLPAMKELRDAPTRPLDKFETTGLEVIQKGDDGFAARRGEEMRFVGAIRSTRQCVECHGGERGDLLGAFSYTLRPSGTQPTQR